MSCFLNSSSESKEHNLKGKVFQSVGVNTEESQSTLVFSLRLGTVCWSVELRVLAVPHTTITTIQNSYLKPLANVKYTMFTLWTLYQFPIWCLQFSEQILLSVVFRCPNNNLWTTQLRLPNIKKAHITQLFIYLESLLFHLAYSYANKI